MITWKNYEEYMMMHADGELQPAEEQELMSFLYDHPELQHELTAFSMAKLIPDTELVYNNKAALLKPIHEKKVIAFPTWRRYAVAAGVAAIVCFSFFKLSNNTTDSRPTIAAIEPAKTTETTAAVAATTTTKITPTAQPVVAATKVAPVNEDVITQPINKPKHTTVQHNVSVAVHATANNDRQGEGSRNAVQPITVKAITKAEDYMTANAVAMEKSEPEKYEPEIVTNVPALAIQIQEEVATQQQSILNNLPINDLKKQGMEQVATALASGYDRVNAIRHGIAETNISLRIEKRKLIVSF
ncbi:MAG: hypothetical protein K9G49_07400 [Taibaiella sp.]|nr:hypothetical protein [Taibaiella sp.]